MNKKKIISYSIAAVVLIALSVWVKIRWVAWFVSLPETEFSYTQVPDRITLTPGEDLLTQRTVSWRCDTIERPSYLLLVSGNDTTSFKASPELVVCRGGKDMFYHVRLDGLHADSVYSYKVKTSGNESGWYKFRMPTAGDKRRIMYVGDVQDTIGGNSGELFSKLYDKYRDVDFWAFGGDLIEAPVDKYWKYVYSSADSAFSTVPVVCATGNHEYIKNIYRKLDPRWTRTFVYPDNGARWMKGRSYYVGDDNMVFIVLDTNGLQDPFTLSAEYYWLRDILAENTGKWKIVMLHHPLYSVRPKKNNFIIRNTFGPLIEKYGVHLVLQNHEHGYMRMLSPDSGKRGYPVYVLSHASPKSYKTVDKMDGARIIPDKRMYQIIETSGNVMTFKAYDAEQDSLLDVVRISKK